MSITTGKTNLGSRISAALALVLLCAGNFPSQVEISPQANALEDSCQTRQLQISQSQLMKFEVEHGDTTIAFSITSPDSKKKFTLKSTSHLPLTFFFPARSAGTYTIETTNVSSGLGESARCNVSPVRLIKPGDENLIAASTLLVEGDNLWASETPPSLKDAIAKYRSVLSLVGRAPTSRQHTEAHAVALIGIGRAQNGLNQAKLAVGNLERALASDIADSAVRVSGLVELARAYMALGKPDKAMEATRSALTHANSSGRPFAQALAFQTLADLHYELNEYEVARKYAQEGIRLFEALGNRRGYAHTLITLGLIASDLSNSERATSFYTQALSTSRVVNYRAGIVDALTYSGHLSAKEGRLHEAIEYYIAAGDNARELGDQLRQSWITSGLAYVYNQAGDGSRALEYYQRTLALRLEVDNLSAEASIYSRLAASYAAVEEYQKAAQFFEKAAGLYRLFNQSVFLFAALRDLGRVYENSGQFERAAQYYAQAKPLVAEAEDPHGLAYLMQGIGRLSERDSKWDAAFENYSEALRLHRIARDRRGESEAMYRLAMLDAKQGKLQIALRQLESTLQNDESLRREIQSPDLRASYLSDVRRHYESHIDVLMQLHKANPAAGFMKQAFEASEQGRARSLLESMQDSHRVETPNDVSELRSRAEKLKNELSAKANRRAELIRLGPGKSVAALNEEINELSDEYERIESAIRFRRSRVAGFEPPKVSSLEQIQGQLDEGTVLLEYALGDERSYAWAVTANSLDGFELPSRKTIESLARSLYVAISDSSRSVTNPSKPVLTEGRVSSIEINTATLSRMIIGPVLAKIRSQRIVVVADGALHLVPFANLSLGSSAGETETGSLADRQPLISTHEIVSLPSASVISVLRADTKKRQSSSKLIAVLADPVFSPDDPRVANNYTRRTPAPSAVDSTTQALRDAGLLEQNGELPRLIASRWEADAIIAAAGGNATKATDFGASLTTALSPNLRDYRMVHFATHAVLDTQRPSLSGIVLSLFDEQGRPQPGYLRAIDIYGMDLSAELVTLSACQTAVGREFKGEGMIGLSRAFMQAGTKRVVASLWKVDDSATAALMAEFYKEMFTNGKRPAAALREAQIRISQKKRWRSPYYWAGFVLQGEWR